jgi:hypothetical protein
MSVGEALDAPGARIGRERVPEAIAVTICLLLIPVELGWIPGLEYAWGTNFWSYLPSPVAYGLAAATLLLCWRPARGLLISAVAALGRPFRGPSGRWLAVATLVVLPALLWLLRERHFFGDALFLMMASLSGFRFAVPDIGSFYLFALAVRTAQALGIDATAFIQALSCVLGSVAIGAFALVSRGLAPSGGSRALIVALALCGGVARVFVGHVEIYAFVLIFAALYLHAAFSFLAGRCAWWVPSLALGAGIWLHLSFAFLAPTLPLLFHLSDPRQGFGALAARSLQGWALAALPIPLFLLVMWMLGYEDDLARTWNKALHILGFFPNKNFEGSSLIRLWWQESVAGTDYVLFSWAHLKHLANAYFILAPAAPPILVGFLVFARDRFTATREQSFLTGATACMLLYCVAVRPVWGPHDWDQFALTAVCLGLLAGALVAGTLEAGLFTTDLRAHVAALAIGGSLLFVTVPFVALTISPTRAAGPFVLRDLPAVEGDTSWDLFLKQVEPWL